MKSFFYLFFWSVFEATWTPQNLDFRALAYTRCYFSLFRRSRFSSHFGFILEVFFYSKCFQEVIQKTLQKKSRNWGQKGFQKGPEGAPKTSQKPLKQQTRKNMEKRGSQGNLTDKKREAPFLSVYCFRWLSVASRIFLSRPTVSRGFPWLSWCPAAAHVFCNVARGLPRLRRRRRRRRRRWH